MQILAEAHTLLTFDRSLRAVAVIGGRNISTEKGEMGFRGGAAPTVDILIGTPGRMIDHLDNTREWVAVCVRVHVYAEGGGEGLDGSLAPLTSPADFFSVLPLRVPTVALSRPFPHSAPTHFGVCVVASPAALATPRPPCAHARPSFRH